MLKKIALAALLGSSLVLTACQSTPSTPSDTITQANLLQLRQSTWILTHIGRLEVRADTSVRNLPSLHFSSDNRVSGADGCNRIMGSYTVGRDTLNLSQLATTRMACLNNTAIPAKFNEALGQVTHYQVYNKTLKLLDRQGNPVLTFSSSVQPR